MEKIIVYGAGEFSELIDNLLTYKEDFQIAAYCDDNPEKFGTERNHIPILSGDEVLAFAREKEINKGIIAIGNNRVRAEKFRLFSRAGIKLISVIHPRSLIDTQVTYGSNVIIEMGTAIHTKTKVGDNVFLGGEALLGHHNIIGDHVLVGGGAAFGGSVKVGDYSTIGVGASIKPGVTIGSGSIVGVGAVVVKDVPDNVIVAGVPAKIIGSAK